MPTYQYVCTECGGQLEAVQKFTDDPLTVHDDCGGKLRKVFSPVGIVFKGSGFYRTDSRDKKSSSSSSSDAKSDTAKPDTGKPDSAKSDSSSSSSSSEPKSSSSPESSAKATSSSSGAKVA